MAASPKHFSLAPARLGKLLRERVEEAPFDDAPRLVYADYLLEKRDPRGDFIQLSFEQERRKLDARELKKVAAILKVHELSWLGPLYDVTFGRQYARGFLDSCYLDERAAPDKILAAANHRAWSTVRALNLRFAEWGTDLVMQPCMRGLRKIDDVRVSDIVRLATHPSPLGIEEISLSRRPDDDIANLPSALDSASDSDSSARGLSQWKRLEVSGVFDPQDLAWLLETDLAARLDVLVLNQWPKSLPAWIAGLQTARIRSEINLGFGSVFRGGDGRYSSLQIRLNPSHQFASFTAAEVAKALEALPTNALTTLNIEGVPESMLETYRALAKRQRRLAGPATVT